MGSGFESTFLAAVETAGLSRNRHAFLQRVLQGVHPGSPLTHGATPMRTVAGSLPRAAIVVSSYEHSGQPSRRLVKAVCASAFAAIEDFAALRDTKGALDPIRHELSAIGNASRSGFQSACERASKVLGHHVSLVDRLIREYIAAVWDDVHLAAGSGQLEHVCHEASALLLTHGRREEPLRTAIERFGVDPVLRTPSGLRS